MSNVVPIRPRPPVCTLALNAHELRFIMAALDNAEHTIAMSAPAARDARLCIRVLHARLGIALDSIDAAPP